MCWEMDMLHKTKTVKQWGQIFGQDTGRVINEYSPRSITEGDIANTDLIKDENSVRKRARGWWWSVDGNNNVGFRTCVLQLSIRKRSDGGQ